jgi:hypothetical protein
MFYSKEDYLSSLEDSRAAALEDVGQQIDNIEETIGMYQSKAQKSFRNVWIFLSIAIVIVLLKILRIKSNRNKAKKEELQQSMAQIIGRRFKEKDLVYELTCTKLDTIKANLHKADRETLENFLLYLKQQVDLNTMPTLKTIYQYALDLYSQPNVSSLTEPEPSKETDSP